MDLYLQTPAHRFNFARFADVKQWFESVIRPDFSSNEALTALGNSEASPRQKHFLPAMTPSGMQHMHSMTDQYNAPPEGETTRFSCCSRWFSPLKPGSVRSCSAALAATALGSGSLALPYAFSLTGIGLGLITMFFAVITSAFSLQILMISARYTQENSYASLLWRATKSRVLSFFLDLCIVLNGVGSITCILIFLGDFVPSVFGAPLGLDHGLHVDRRYAVVGAALLAYPLTWPENLSALRYTSVLVPVVLMITIIIVWTQVPQYFHTLHENGDHIVWFNLNWKKWFAAVPIMVNSFTNHQNAIPSGNLLETPSIARIVKATVNANIVIFLVLSAIGIGGYMSFGPLTKGDFILNYPSTNPWIWVCRVLLSITVYFVLPVALSPAAKSCAQLVLSALPGGRNRTVSRPLHLFSTTLCLATCTGIAVATSDISAVINILGGILATSVMFWFPAFVYYCILWPTQPRCVRYLVLGSMLIFGICGYVSVVLMFFK